MPVSGASKLPDANVWLALAFSDHVHHQRAAEWFGGQLDGSCAFCRVTQLALLRHLTNAKVMGNFVKRQVDAWRTFDAYLGDPRVASLTEPGSTESEFRALTQATSPSHFVWTDAYLAAFAKASALTVVTFDQGFRRFGSISLELLP